MLTSFARAVLLSTIVLNLPEKILPETNDYFYTTFTKKPLNYFRGYVNSAHQINCCIALHTVSPYTVDVIRDYYFIITPSSILYWNTRPWFQSNVKNFKMIILTVHPQRKFNDELGWPMFKKCTYRLATCLPSHSLSYEVWIVLVSDLSAIIFIIENWPKVLKNLLCVTSWQTLLNWFSSMLSSYCFISVYLSYPRNMVDI